jgi:hypothetical protein
MNLNVTCDDDKLEFSNGMMVAVISDGLTWKIAAYIY